MKTIFEKIRDKEIPSYMVYEDDVVMAFLDISQATKGHTLIVSKEPYKDYLHTPDDVLKHMSVVSKKVMQALSNLYQPLGFNVLNNLGEIAGQTVFHIHIHVIPRYSNKDVTFAFHPDSSPTKEDFIELHQSLKSALL